MALDTAEIFLGKKIDKDSNYDMVNQIVKELEERYQNK